MRSGPLLCAFGVYRGGRCRPAYADVRTQDGMEDVAELEVEFDSDTALRATEVTESARAHSYYPKLQVQKTC